MPLAAKAFFVVTAGLIPEEPDPELSRQWNYTSKDYEADKARSADENTAFAAMRDEALSYAREGIDPSRTNWVRLEFIWL